MEENQTQKVKRDPYAKYKLDPALVKAGIWYEDADQRVLVTYAGPENTRYDKMMKLRLKPYETRIRQDDFPDAEFHKIQAEVYAAVVVLGYQVRDYDKEVDGVAPFVDGCYDAEGNIIQPNEFAVAQAFNLGNRLFLDVVKLATNFNLFRQGQKAEDLGN